MSARITRKELDALPADTLAGLVRNAIEQAAADERHDELRGRLVALIARQDASERITVRVGTRHELAEQRDMHAAQCAPIEAEMAAIEATHGSPPGWPGIRSAA